MLVAIIYTLVAIPTLSAQTIYLCAYLAKSILK